MEISKVTGIAATALLVTSISLWEMGMRIIMVPILATSFVACIVTFASHNAINVRTMDLGEELCGEISALVNCTIYLALS
ncbi:hypothetical protein ACP70R_020458 [Stipagrostis hirtigluma subsp. patula]